ARRAHARARARPHRAGRLRAAAPLQVLGVPGVGLGEPAVEVPLRAPAELLADGRGVQPLAVDLAVRRPLPPDVGLDVAAGDLDELAHDVDDRDRLARAGVPRAAPVRLVVERLPDAEVGARRILD